MAIPQGFESCQILTFMRLEPETQKRSLCEVRLGREGGFSY